jgi:hypothetical protein
MMDLSEAPRAIGPGAALPANANGRVPSIQSTLSHVLPELSGNADDTDFRHLDSMPQDKKGCVLMNAR